MTDKIIEMEHPEAVLHIWVPRSQIFNAEYHGWREVTPAADQLVESEENENGESSRK